MKVVLAAGGSGGHIFPAVAVADELEKKGAKKIYFISSKRKLDKNILDKVHYEKFFLSVNPMPYRLNPVKYIVFVCKFIADIFSSLFILIKVRPNVVVGFGGYSTGSASICAKVLGIPIIIHEQNLVPGRANKILARIVDKIAVSFKESDEYFPKNEKKVVFTGNPLRKNMLNGKYEEAVSHMGLSDKKPTVLVMGGSQGSSFLNGTVSEALSYVKKSGKIDFQVIHLTGQKDHEKVDGFYRENGINAKVYPFLDRMGDAYAASDIAISRSGAAAIFELACYAKPMILIPYPNPKNNQRQNAAYFAQKGAAIYLKEKEIFPEHLAEYMVHLLKDGDARREMSDASFMLSKIDAAEKVAEEAIKLANQK